MVLLSCSFDYGLMEEGESDQPDLVMQDVDYVRVTDGSIAFHMQADRIDHFENNHLFQVQNIRFEQFSEGVTEPDSVGAAGFAQFWTTTQDAVFAEGVRIMIPSRTCLWKPILFSGIIVRKNCLGPWVTRCCLKKAMAAC